jgi:hypothetical protein
MTATEPVDPTKAVGRLLPEGWRVERTYGYDGGTWLFGTGRLWRRVDHGDTVEVVVECTPEDCAWTPSRVCCEYQPADVEGGDQ